MNATKCQTALLTDMGLLHDNWDKSVRSLVDGLTLIHRHTSRAMAKTIYNVSAKNRI